MLSLFKLDDRTVEALFILALAGFMAWLLFNHATVSEKLAGTQAKPSAVKEAEDDISRMGETWTLLAPGTGGGFSSTSLGTV